MPELTAWTYTSGVLLSTQPHMATVGSPYHTAAYYALTCHANNTMPYVATTDESVGSAKKGN